MKFLVPLAAVIAAVSAQNLDKVVTKSFNLGLVSGKVTDKPTCKDPSLLAQKPIANITTDAKNCVISKSGKFYMSVLNLYNSGKGFLSLRDFLVNKCLGGDALTMLSNMLSVGKPIVSPLYDKLMAKISDWTKQKLPNATIADNMWGWVNNQMNKTIINKFCTNIVQQKAVNKTEWACAKNPGNQAIDFSSYACYKLSPAS